uniref:Uncharacterized protein n=1 Tax=Arundo donax TaxID=35708 RepID=A0A0A9GSW4_ARUDO
MSFTESTHNNMIDMHKERRGHTFVHKSIVMSFTESTHNPSLHRSSSSTLARTR